MKTNSQRTWRKLFAPHLGGKR